MECLIHLLFLAVFFIHGCSSSVEWLPLGCFKDSVDRAMDQYFATKIYNKDSPDFKDMFEQLRKKAEENSYTYFDIQHMQECWGSENAREMYDKHGCAENCRQGNDGYGAGQEWANFVYRIKQVNDGRWSEYSKWSECTQTCGDGIQTRTRICTKPAPLNGGNNCVGESKETRSCNTQKCPPCRVHTTNGKCCVFSFIHQGKIRERCDNKCVQPHPTMTKTENTDGVSQNRRQYATSIAEVHQSKLLSQSRKISCIP